MDSRLRKLQRLSGVDPDAKDRYIRELERLIGLGETPEEAKLKCLVNNCPNCADQGYGIYLLTQPNKPGEAPYTWDNALGPLFLCSPCYANLKNAPWRPPANNGPGLGGAITITGGIGVASGPGGPVVCGMVGATGIQGAW